MKVYCPKCHWEPCEWDQWICHSTCKEVFNPFMSCGVCPRCSHVWEHTQCMNCHQWSLHLDWYHDDVPATGKEAQRDIKEPGT